MILNSVVSSKAFPNEKLIININNVDPPLLNARIGVRFPVYTYNTPDKFSYSSIPLTGINILDENGYPVASAGLGINQFANFVNIPEAFPLTWSTFSNNNTTYSANHYLYITFLGPSSALTVHPSQPYPKISALSPTYLSVTGAFMPFHAYEGLVDKEQFRKTVSLDDTRTNSELDFIFQQPEFYFSKSRRKYNIGNIKNYSDTYTITLNKNIIDSSFVIDVPIVSSKEQVDQIWRYTLYDSLSPRTATYTGTANLTGMKLESIDNALMTSSFSGTSSPYFSNSKLNRATGALTLKLKSPLLFAKQEDVFVTYETKRDDLIPLSPTLVSNAIPHYDFNCANYTIAPLYDKIIPMYLMSFKYIHRSFNSIYMDAYTINFNPSAGLINPVRTENDGLTSIDSNIIFHDNYYQTFHNIISPSNVIKKRFIERTGDLSLSAYDLGTNILYNGTQWMPASSTMRFINDGGGNNYTVGIQVSSVVDSIYECFDDLNFLLNNKHVAYNLSMTESTDLSGVINSSVLPTPDPSFLVKWDAFPPENITFKDPYDSSVSFSPGSYYPYGDGSIEVHNLGVDITKIIAYSQEFDLSASTYWFPSENVFSDTFLEVKSTISDYDPLNVGTVSALVNRNGLLYRVPNAATIKWDELLKNPKGTSTFKTSNSAKEIIEKSTSFSSSFETACPIIELSTTPVEKNPSLITFDVQAHVFNNLFDSYSNKLISIREYPKNSLLSINASSNGILSAINTSAKHHIVDTTDRTWSLSAYYPDVDITESTLIWNARNSNNISFSGQGNIFNINLSSLSATISLSSANATPYIGNFGKYNMYDTLNLYLLSTITPFAYIGFPSHSYNPNNELTYDNYTSSYGMTSLKPCHTENFLFSATPGFDNYVWRVGNVYAETITNKVTIPISYNNVSADNTVGVSAYNDIFIDTDEVTIYNSASSDNSSIYRQDVTFIDYPTADVVLSVNNTLVDIAQYSQTPLLNVDIDTKSLTLDSYNFNIVLSSVNGVQTKNYNGSKYPFLKLIKIQLENSDFTIPDNSFNVMSLTLSGNISVVGNNSDFCVVPQDISTNTLYLSVYSGPQLELYTNTNVVSTDEVITFYNTSNSNFTSTLFATFTSFSFDNGSGSTLTTTSSAITSKYVTEGLYSPSMTGFMSGGSFKTYTWDDMVYVIDTYESYAPTVMTDIEHPLVLPYNLHDTLVSANSWQYASTLNNTFDKLKTNIDYLSARCAVYNPNFPKTYCGFLGTKYNSFKWNTINSTTSIVDDVFKNIQCGQIVDDKFLCINDGYFEMYDITSVPTLLYSTNTLVESEIMGNIIQLKYNDGQLFLIENDSRMLYILNFDIDAPENAKVSHYWGGNGGRTARTHFNNPIDLVLNNNGDILVLDKESYIIKVYNKYFNWIKNIEIEGLSSDNMPNSISISTDKLSITTDNGITYICDLAGTVLNTITVEDSIGSVLNTISEGIIYIYTTNIIYKYMTNGVYVGKSEHNGTIVDILFFNRQNYIILDNYVEKVVDFIEIDKIISTNLSDDWSDTYIAENEFVTDYILNDSFKKIYDRINIINESVFGVYTVYKDQYNKVMYSGVSARNPTPLNGITYLGTNEPVLYDTINRSIANIFDAFDVMISNVDIKTNFPDADLGLNNIWRWNYHYIDDVQRPSANRFPISWYELSRSRLSTSTTLSTVSAWWVLRRGEGGNHSDICWNYMYTKSNSYFPLTWEDTIQGSVSGHTMTWEYVETNCCKTPEFVFDDCVTICP